MNKRINLFVKKIRSEVLPQKLVLLHDYGIITLLFLVLLTIIAGFSYYYLLMQNQQAKNELQRLRVSLEKSSEVRDDVRQLILKKNQYQTFLANDIGFKNYYELIQERVLGQFPNVQLQEINLSENQMVTLAFETEPFSDSEGFFNYLESEEFRSLFRTVNVTNYDVNAVIVNSTEGPVTIILEGQFEELST